MAGLLPSLPRTHAWMDVPEWCRPAIFSRPARILLEIYTRTNAFQHPYNNLGILERIKVIAIRVFAAIDFFCVGLIGLILENTAALNASIKNRKWVGLPSLYDLTACLVLSILCVGVIAGYLVPISQERLHFLNTPKDASDLYYDIKNFSERDMLPDDYGAAAATAFIKANPEDIHFKMVLPSAAANGDVNALKILLEQGGDKITPITLQAALLSASTRLQAPAMKCLIEHGADPHLKSKIVQGEEADLKSNQINKTLVALLLNVWDVRVATREGNPEEAARLLVRAEVEFNQQHLEEIAKAMQLIKENKIEEFNNWLNTEKSEDQLEPNLFKKYMKTQLEHYRNLGLNAVIIEGGGWIRALEGIGREAFFNRFERVYNTLLAAKKEQMENREKAIVDAVEVLPQAGLPKIISEYCYS